LNGYKATEIIRSLNKSIPVIAQTAYAMADEKERILASGFTDYIVKPLDRNELISKLNKHLK
ncbi:MAG: hybrid sensor histidine kinase/response regulator, partial [Marinilabiliales bacterium]